MISPSPSQPRNHAQLLFVIPVNRYKQVVTPISGMREYFLTKASILKMIQMIQKMIVDAIASENFGNNFKNNSYRENILKVPEVLREKLLV